MIDNHVIDYVPPEVLLEKGNAMNNFKERSKEGLLGMAIVGAVSSDPRLVKQHFPRSLFSIKLKMNLLKVHAKISRAVQELGSTTEEKINQIYGHTKRSCASIHSLFKAQINAL